MPKEDEKYEGPFESQEQEDESYRRYTRLRERKKAEDEAAAAAAAEEAKKKKKSSSLPVVE